MDYMLQVRKTAALLSDEAGRGRSIRSPSFLSTAAEQTVQNQPECESASGSSTCSEWITWFYQKFNGYMNVILKCEMFSREEGARSHFSHPKWTSGGRTGETGGRRREEGGGFLCHLFPYCSISQSFCLSGHVHVWQHELTSAGWFLGSWAGSLLQLQRLFAPC